MKATSFFLLLLVWHTSFSQFNDNFQDGDLTISPAWVGETADFSVINNSLRLTAAPATGSSFLVTQSASINEASWEFRVELGFNPSSSNYAEVYLVADQADFNVDLHGYLVRIGWTSDNISLMRQDGLNKEILIEGTEKRIDLSQVSLNVKVTRSILGEWSLFTKIEGETDWLLEGETADLTYYKSEYFGIKCKYTSTRADKFGFDDFVVTGQPYIDQVAPVIDTTYSVSETSLYLVLSEETRDVTTDNFSINGEAPNNAIVEGDTVKLYMTNSLLVKNKLQVTGISDLAGNVVDDTVYNFVHYSFLPIGYGDIAINEILPDPTPAEDLPEAEYIEIINSSEKAIFMTNWSLLDRSTEVVLPDIRLLPDSLVVLYKVNDAIEWEINNVIGLAKWPSLNNSGDELWLRDSTKNLVDALIYDISMYGDEAKAEGGWSLERLDPYLPCTGSLNWSASVDSRGGTPGVWNSVFNRIVDYEPPLIEQAIAAGFDSIRISFTEPLGDFPGHIEIDGIEVLDISFNSNSLDQIIVKVSDLQPRTVYTIAIHDFADCSGNMTNLAKIEVVLPEHPEQGDVVINEILFNPKEDLHDYIEVLNQSPKFISLEGMHISNGENVKTIGSFNLLAPGEYRVICLSGDELLESYFHTPESSIVENQLPAFVNTKGVGVLRSATGELLDSISYNEDWHFAYLNDVEGVALERLSPLRSGLDKSNWASASAQHNYGTPGYENSQVSNPKFQNNLSIDPSVIVPNADGRDDFSTISLNLKENAVVTLRIFNLQGMEVRLLVNSQMIAGMSSFIWDGTDQQGIAVPLGHYIIVADLVLDNGRTAVFREKMVVGTGY